ncbi:MAG TPA: hypothetical protein VE954_41980, partial [Oligoflexus sp.]|uniref:hypothetical protein n=1 Tax=Oligoflexus sp. TaxID=1971216 RepID=UPI002D367BBD
YRNSKRLVSRESMIEEPIAGNLHDGFRGDWSVVRHSFYPTAMGQGPGKNAWNFSRPLIIKAFMKAVILKFPNNFNWPLIL